MCTGIKKLYFIYNFIIILLLYLLLLIISDNKYEKENKRKKLVDVRIEELTTSIYYDFCQPED